MPSAQRTVIINRPSEEVFSFFTDPDNDQRWRPLVKEISSEGPVGVGTRIHQVVAGPGGRGLPADLEVTAYEPPSRYAFRVTAGPVRPKGRFKFTPDGDSTAVTFTIDAHLGGIKRLLLSRPVQSSMDREVAALDRAKEIIESGGA